MRQLRTINRPGKSLPDGLGSYGLAVFREQDMPVRVFEMEKTGALLNIVMGGNEGTLIEERRSVEGKS